MLRTAAVETLLLEALEQRTVLDSGPLPTLAMLEDANHPVARIETPRGDVDIELFPATSPHGVEAFLTLLKEGAYSGSFFNDLDPGARLRGGLDQFSNANGLSQRTQTFQVEGSSTRANEEMTVALTVNNQGLTPETNGELDFNLGNNSSAGFLVIGKVIQGWSVIQEIAGLPTANLTNFFSGNPAAAGLTNVPVTSPNPNSVDESLLVPFADTQLIKPDGVQAFYSERAYFPEGYSWERTFESIELMNPSQSDTSYQIIVRYENGQRDQVVSTAQVAAEQRASVVVAPGFGAASTIVRNNEPYAYEVWSTQPLAAAFRHKDFKAGVGESFFRPASLADQSAMRDWTFYQAGLGMPGSHGFLVWQNTTGTDATVTLTLYFQDADPVVVNYPLRAHGRGGANLNELGNLSGIVGARVSADQDIVASITRYDQRSGGNTGDEGGIAALGTPGGGTLSGVAPGAVRGSGDPVAVLNTTDGDAHVTFFVSDESGNPPAQRTATIPAGRVLVISGGNNPATLATQGQFFAIRYASDVPVTMGFVTTAFQGTGTPAAVFAATQTQFAEARVFTEPSGSPFGQQTVSISNPGTTAADVQLVFRFNNEQPFTTASFTVDPGQSVHRNLSDFSSELSQFLNGLGQLQHQPYSLTVVSSVPVVAQTSQQNSEGTTEIGMNLDQWVPISSFFPV